MPIARIRTFDPEAISFLAARLAACGFQLRFAAQGETDPEEADLEITVTRMDSATALEQARLQAEEMNVDVTVMPGVLLAAEPAWPAEPEISVEAEPISPARDNSGPIPATAAWTTLYHADVPEEISESSVETETSEAVAAGQPETIRSLTQQNPEAGTAGWKPSAGLLGRFAASSAERMREWKRRASGAGEPGHVQPEQELAVAMEEQRRRAEAEMQGEKLRQQQRRDNSPPAAAIPSLAPSAPKPQQVIQAPPMSRTLHARDRRFRHAAVAAALVLAAAVIGWSFAGLGGPANPVRNSPANVQQQTPFGAASVSAPAQALTAMAPAATSVQPRPAPSEAKPTPPRNARKAHTRTRHRPVQRRSSSADDGEQVVVRHFGTKPAEQQARAKTKDRVKVITEE